MISRVNDMDAHAVVVVVVDYYYYCSSLANTIAGNFSCFPRTHQTRALLHGSMEPLITRISELACAYLLPSRIITIFLVIWSASSASFVILYLLNFTTWVKKLKFNDHSFNFATWSLEISGCTENYEQLDLLSNDC